MSKEKIIKTVYIISFIVYMIFAIICPICLCNTYSYPYKLEVTTSFNRVEASNDLSFIADELVDILEYFKDYSGNPDPFYPTDITDWDVIKYDLELIINVSKEADANSDPGDDAYEEAIRMGKISIESIEERLETSYIWSVWNKIWVVIIFLYAILLPILSVIGIVVFDHYSSYVGW